MAFLSHSHALPVAAGPAPGRGHVAGAHTCPVCGPRRLRLRPDAAHAGVPTEEERKQQQPRQEHTSSPPVVSVEAGLIGSPAPGRGTLLTGSPCGAVEGVETRAQCCRSDHCLGCDYTIKTAFPASRAPGGAGVWTKLPSVLTGRSTPVSLSSTGVKQGLVEHSRLSARYQLPCPRVPFLWPLIHHLHFTPLSFHPGRWSPRAA